MTIETQVKVLETMVSKIEVSIEKLTQVSTDVGKLLAVHVERINTIEKVNDRMDNEIKEIHSRITTTSREICDKIDKMEQAIEDRIKEHEEVSSYQNSKILDQHFSNIRDISARLEILENWRWLIIGGAVVVGYLISNIKAFI